MLMWSYALHDSLSGDPRVDVFPASVSAPRQFTQPGQGQHVFKLRDSLTAMPRQKWRDETEPWARTLVTRWNGVPWHAGLITGRSYDRGRGELTVRHAELPQLLKRRFMFSFDEFSPPNSLVVSNRSRRGLIRAVAQAGLYRPTAPFWTMPVIYPDDEAGPFSMTWWHYQTKTVEEMLSEVSRMEASPDWDFKPRYVDGRLRWELVIGSPRLPGALVEVHDAADTPAVDVGWSGEALDQATGALVVGQGSEGDMAWAIQGNRDQPTKPWLDRTWSEKSVSDPGALQALASGWMDQFERVPDQLSLSVHAGAGVPVEDLQPGARIRLHTYGDEFLNDGHVDLYTLSATADTSHKIGLEVVKL